MKLPTVPMQTASKAQLKQSGGASRALVGLGVCAGRRDLSLEIITPFPSPPYFKGQLAGGGLRLSQALSQAPP